MKKLLFVLGLFAILAISCGKTDSTGCTPVPVASEKAALVKFCTDNNITYTEHPSGLLYQIITPGAGAPINANSTVNAVYTGKLFNGTIFDARATPVEFSLSGVIEGWTIGIPLVRRGGRILLVIPSSLAYSCVGNNRGSVIIPPNTPLYFDVTVN